jgi:protein-tyrosine phosphatase
MSPADPPKKISVLMVCMGNICRSPTAEAVLRQKLVEAGMARQVVVDSAGTHAWHAGEPPDRRAISHARKRGYDLTDLRARVVTREDFERCDFILAMDWDNLDLLEDQCPEAHRAKLGRLTQHCRQFREPVVPDPYQGGAAEFERVLDLVEDASDGFIEFLRRRKIAAASGTS